MSSVLSDSPTSLTDPSINWVGGGDESGAESPTADTPSSDAGAAQPPVGATTDAADTSRAGENGTGPSEEGSIPFDRHKAILESQRSEADARWQRVAWADELTKAGKSPEQIREALDIYDRVDGDPSGFLEKFYEQLSAHPIYAPQVRSWAGRVLAGHRSRGAESAAGQDDPKPQPDYYGQDAAGNRIPVYSPEGQRKWGEWQARQLKASLGAEITPLREHIERQQFIEGVRQVWKTEEDRTKAEIEAYRAKPHFKEHEKDFVRPWMAARQWKAPLAEAYNALLLEKIIPNLSRTEQAALLTTLKTQAAAGTSVNPRAGAAVTPAAPTSFRDSRLKWD